MSSRFLRVTPRMEAFSLDLLGAAKKWRMCFGTVVWWCAKKVDGWNF